LAFSVIKADKDEKSAFEWVTAASAETDPSVLDKWYYKYEPADQITFCLLISEATMIMMGHTTFSQTSLNIPNNFPTDRSGCCPRYTALMLISCCLRPLGAPLKAVFLKPSKKLIELMQNGGTDYQWAYLISNCPPKLYPFLELVWISIKEKKFRKPSDGMTPVKQSAVATAATYLSGMRVNNLPMARKTVDDFNGHEDDDWGKLANILYYIPTIGVTSQALLAGSYPITHQQPLKQGQEDAYAADSLTLMAMVIRRGDAVSTDVKCFGSPKLTANTERFFATYSNRKAEVSELRQAARCVFANS
jgi:hypothetical protein